MEDKDFFLWKLIAITILVVEKLLLRFGIMEKVEVTNPKFLQEKV